MKPRAGAPQAPDEGLLTFCDVAACFSEEEWTLLQNWQKQLYKNVMMEIRQAFSSLGHYVPGPGDGLTTEEESGFGLMDSHDVEEDEGSAGPWFGPAYVTPDASLNIKREGGPRSLDALPSEVKGPASAGPKVTPPAASIGIDEDGEIYAIDSQDYPRLGYFPRPAGEGRVDPRREVDHSSVCKDKGILRESAAEQLNVNIKMVGVTETKNLIKNMWSGSNQEVKEEKTEEGPNGCSQQMCSSFYQVMPSTHISEAYTKHDIMSNHNPVSYSYPEREQNRGKSTSTGQQRAHQGKERHACTECGKSLRSASALRRHERVHTGERPFVCSICGKSYNQKEVLQRHQKMHTGEKPYPCGVCGKRFALKHNLVGHQTTHKRPQRSYEIGSIGDIANAAMCHP
ncbi:uncharacterized protein LOC144770976 isoform X2 [Lissotriton helveticus]